MNIAILLAGGTGSRLGAEKPKQFIEVLGKPLIVYAMQIYENSPLIDKIEVVCVPEYIDFVWEVAKSNHISKLAWVVQGGNSCQDSTRNGIFYLEGKVKDDDMITVNMSTSVFVSEDILEDSFEVAKKHGSAFACLQCVYNNAETEDGLSSMKINYKEKNRTINLPWTSSFGKLFQMYKKAYQNGIETGQTSYMPTLFIAMGEPIFFSKDNALNKIHITRKEDIEIVEAILVYRGEKLK